MGIGHPQCEHERRTGQEHDRPEAATWPCADTRDKSTNAPEHVELLFDRQRPVVQER